MIREIKLGSKKVAGLTMSASDQIPIDPKPDRRAAAFQPEATGTGMLIDLPYWAPIMAVRCLSGTLG
jgi:hypothetical protein